jgi:hypothetical protein
MVGGGGLRAAKEIHFRLKPHLREIFRHLDVTSRYTLTLTSDGL